MQSKKSNMNLSEEKTYTDLSVNIFSPKKIVKRKPTQRKEAKKNICN